MSVIKMMSAELANMIAAGEVIERPSSVIKELVENSIDAGSRHISIAVFSGGKELIEVKDDGTGMDREDALLSFKRHASSKIKSVYDLMRIKTLGFRGEAIPSIASVSKMKLITSTGEGVGTEVLTEPSGKMEVRDAPLRKGTLFSVNELFYNTPARLKYLKSERTENSSSIEAAEHLALGFPDIAFSFKLDGRMVFQTTGRGDLLETISSIYGNNIAKCCIPFCLNGEGYTANGFIGHPSINYSTRYSILTFLNERTVYIPKVQRAIIDGYKDYLPPARYPFTVISIKVDYSLVDVNVHPSKKEVRLSCEEDLARDIHNQVMKTLLLTKNSFHETAIPEVKSPSVLVGERKDEDNKSLSASSSFIPSAPLSKEEKSPSESISSLFESQNPNQTFQVDDSLGYKENEPIVQKEPVRFEQKAGFPSLTPIGQVLRTYIVCDGEDGIYLIDQHAAAERINFEECQKEFQEEKTLLLPLFPVVCDLTPMMMNNYDEDHIGALDRLGIKTELFGKSSIKAVSVPSFLGQKEDNSVLIDIITQVLSDQGVDVGEIERKAIATKACHMSVKANNTLTQAEQVTLIKKLADCRNPLNCPHGRPTIVKLSKYEIEKLFKRTGFGG